MVYGYEDRVWVRFHVKRGVHRYIDLDTEKYNAIVSGYQEAQYFLQNLYKLWMFIDDLTK